MTSEIKAVHLELCRKFYDQLRWIQAHQQHKESAATTNLPISFPVFVRTFELYLKWVERNSRSVDHAIAKPRVQTARCGP